MYSTGNNFAHTPAQKNPHQRVCFGRQSMGPEAKPESKGEIKYENCTAATEESAIQRPLLKSHLLGRVSDTF